MEATKDGIGLDPEAVDEQAPSDEAVLEYLETQASPEQQADDLDLDQDVPSRAELFQVVMDQQERIEALEERIDDLEQRQDDVEFEADTLDEVAEQFRKGEIGGEAGAQFLREFVSIPQTGNVIDARARKLFFTIIQERMVGKPVKSKHITQWLNLHDSTNPSQQAKRVMERLERHREDGYFIGSIETGKYRGQNCIWLNRD